MPPSLCATYRTTPRMSRCAWQRGATPHARSAVVSLQLGELFADVGPVRKCFIVKDKGTSAAQRALFPPTHPTAGAAASRGFGFVHLCVPLAASFSSQRSLSAQRCPGRR